MAMRPAKTDDTQTDLATQRTRTRDEAQRELDTDVAKLITEWETAGSPETGIPNRRYEVDDVTEGKRRVNRAFTLASKDRTPKLAPMWFKDGTKDAEGYVPIKFGVRVSTVADQKAAADAETPAPTANAASAAPEGNGDQTGDAPPFEGDDTGHQDVTPREDAASGGRGFRRGR